MSQDWVNFYIIAYVAYSLACLLLPIIVTLKWGLDKLLIALPLAFVAILVLPPLYVDPPRPEPGAKPLWDGAYYQIPIFLLILGTVLTFAISGLIQAWRSFVASRKQPPETPAD